ncbi:MAG: hypothetical protein EA382_06960 [Spirochaetaceae bacterium]|nr:MAG: hypothetical protein EA382_06960 [Spirochaetaceae bacterium]
MTWRAAVRVVASAVAACALIVLASCTTTLSRADLAVEYYNLGTAYFEIGRYERSAEFLARAITLDDSLARAGYNLSRAYAMLGRYADSATQLELLLAGDPDNVLVISTLAYVEYRRGDLDRAAVLFDRAIDLNPAGVDLLINRATIAELQDDSDRGLELLVRAVDLDPSRVGIRRRIADAFVAAGRPLDAIDALRRLRTEQPDDTDATLLLAGLLASERFVAEAIDAYAAVAANEALDDAVRARAGFAQARLLLVDAREADLGIESLLLAIELGYRDAESVRGLLADDIAGRDRVVDLLTDAGLLPETASPRPDDQAGDLPDETDDEPANPD